MNCDQIRDQQGRAQGKTFRVLLQAIGSTSALGYDKDGVVLYCHSVDYAKELFKKAKGIIDSYHGAGTFDYTYTKLTILFPNHKTLQFKSMRESSDNNKGINWSKYDELADDHVIFDALYYENKQERDLRRLLHAKSK